MKRFLSVLALLPLTVLPAFAAALVWEKAEIAETVVWEGEVTVKGPVVVKKEGSLVIRAGSAVTFAFGHHEEHAKEAVHKEEHGEEHEAALLVLGSLSVEGTPESRVEFSFPAGFAEEDPHDLLSIQGARKAFIDHAYFKGVGWAVHLHETPEARVKGCVFEGNYGGLRFRSDGLLVEGNTFTGNAIALRTIGSRGVRILSNRFSGNGTGIFFREGIAQALVKGNVFDNLDYDIKLGEAQTDDVEASENTWAGKSASVADRIWDGEDSPGVGRVNYAPSNADKKE